jgi:hypothetical protein
MKRFLYVAIALLLMAPTGASGAQPPWEVVVVQDNGDATIYAYDLGSTGLFKSAKVVHRPACGQTALYAGMAFPENGFPYDAVILTYLGTDGTNTAHFNLKQGNMPLAKQKEYVDLLNLDKASAHDIDNWISWAAMLSKRWALDSQTIYSVVAAVPSTMRLRGLGCDVIVELSQDEDGLLVELANVAP